MTEAEDTPQHKSRHRGWVKPVLLIAAVALLLATGRYFNVSAHLRTALEWINGLGPAGVLVFILLYMASTVFFLPGSVLTLGAGFVFGVIKGTILVSAGSTLGATAAFIVGRYLARDWVAARIERNKKFKAIDEAVAGEGWKIVGLTRLSPIFPFNLLNYAFGLTKVKLLHYVIASWIGMIPGTIMYVYLGSLAGSLATVGAGERTRTPGEWALYGLGLLATVVVTVYVTKIARRTLQHKIASSPDASEQEPAELLEADAETTEGSAA